MTGYLPRAGDRAALVLCLCVAISFCLVSTASNYLYHRRVMERLMDLERFIQHLEDTMLTTEWVSGGKKRTWTSTQGATESLAALAERHAAEVAALLETFPEDS